ncbi:alpha-glucosidase [Clostridium sp. WILCCON 0269]|uniref:Alpha-glucosidase n=1 Tax=Candidatus Clostridium eludens TaxID=3381663 RepID=A0ABW8SKW3_9CLOT
MERFWWKEAVFYEIYIRSFMDSTGDGIGDLKGIISKLDYLRDLGIDAIWISPMYKSPNCDNGYDISDYMDISREFGTLDDFYELLRQVHVRDMKLIIDLVINHTSDLHPWFIESRKCKNNSKRNFYIWKQGVKNAEPSNWKSIFGGSVWEYDRNTEEYYFHLFSKNQPDLNWENSKMREKIYDMINWWLERGVDGFRIDAISHIKKDMLDKRIPDVKGERYADAFEKYTNVQGIFYYLKELKERTFDRYSIVTVGEANGVTAEQAPLWVNEEDGIFNMIFQFELLNLFELKSYCKMNILDIKKILSKWQKVLENKGWNALFIENHDLPRIVSILGDEGQHLRESATCIAAMYFFMKGTPFIYQGQEIGMTNIKLKNIEEYDDIKSRNFYYDKLKEGMSKEEILKILWASSRDNSRSPMQWNNTKNAGFTSGVPWFSVNENHRKINVENELREPDSILNFYKRMIRIRKEHKVFIYGGYELILKDDDKVYAYIRSLESEKAIVICNLSREEVLYKYDKIKLKLSNLLLGNYDVNEESCITEFILKPYETRIYKLDCLEEI